MRAAVCPVYGPPEGVEVQELPEPILGPGQVRVRVAAAAVNFPDVLLLTGSYQVQVPPPFVPGSEFAGEVIEAGEGVDPSIIGRRVFGSVMVGAFAEQVVTVPQAVTEIPAGVATEAAAAFGVASRTSYLTLRAVADLQPGEELVVLGAGSGVGLAAVQLGAVLGARVTAVASSAEKLAAAEAAGASALVNHRAGDLREALRAAAPEGVDVVVDPVGGPLSERALRALRWGGRFVTVGYAAGEIPRIPLNLVLLKGIRIVGFEFLGFAAHHPEDFARYDAELLGLLADGRAVPHIGARYPLEQAAAALRHVVDGRAVGKVVVEIST